LQFVIQKALGIPPPLRLPAGAGRRDGQLGGAQGTVFDPAIKQMAIHVEDHPLGYNTFEGTIPKGEYGGGTVIVWDRGTWEPVGDPREGLSQGQGHLQAPWREAGRPLGAGAHLQAGAKKQDQWLLLKKRGDAWARPASDYDVITALPDSVVAKPLGLVEERDPREAAVPARLTPADTTADLQHAKKAALPAKLAPQLATLVSAVPPGDWVVETKFDGYRCSPASRAAMCAVHAQWQRLDRQAETDRRRPWPTSAWISAWLDGEIVVLNDAGLPDFNRLAERDRQCAGPRTSNDVPVRRATSNGMDLREVPLMSRRALLKEARRTASTDIVGSANRSKPCPVKC
jgi:bifunctional non-homologous end joining protein LigD